MNQELLRSVSFLNPWWQSNKVPSELTPTFKRQIFSKLLSYLSLERIIILKGPRRTGKSTLFYQIIQSLLEKKVSPEKILFASFDVLKPNSSLDEIITAWEMLVKKTTKEMGEVFIFLDEVSYLSSWSLMVKKYFDRRLPFKFLVSSSSASLFDKETESLAGRTVEEILLPFTLSEMTTYYYPQFKPLVDFDLMKIDLGNLIPFESQLKVTLEKYMEKGGFPHILTVSEKSLWQKLLREDVVEKVIYRDLVNLYQIKKPQVLENVFSYTQAITSGILNISEIASSCGLSREYTEKYLFYLEKAYLLFRLPKFSRSPKETMRSNKKIHLVDPGIAALSPNVGKDAVFESVVASHLVRQFRDDLFYWRDGFEIDLVIRRKSQFIPCEVKNTSEVGSAEKNIFNFLEKFGDKEGVIVYQGNYQKKKVKGKTIFLYPAWAFLGGI